MKFNTFVGYFCLVPTVINLDNFARQLNDGEIKFAAIDLSVASVMAILSYMNFRVASIQKKRDGIYKKTNCLEKFNDIKTIKDPTYGITGLQTFDFTPPMKSEQEIAKNAFVKSAKLNNSARIAARVSRQKK